MPTDFTAAVTYHGLNPIRHETIVIPRTKGPVVISECENVTFLVDQIRGGPDNLQLNDCTNVHIRGGDRLYGLLQNPTGRPDPYGHNLLFNRCRDCTASRLRLCSIVGELTEDHLSICQSINCTFTDIDIIGPTTLSGSQVLVDYRSRNITLLCIHGDGQGSKDTPIELGLSITAGGGHVVTDCSMSNVRCAFKVDVPPKTKGRITKVEFCGCTHKGWGEESLYNGKKATDTWWNGNPIRPLTTLYIVTSCLPRG